MLHTSAKELLEQLSNVVDACKEEDFGRSLPELSNATIGQHIRHTLEFFLCLMDAEKGGLVNYDCRRHDELIETDKNLANSVIASISDLLDQNQDDFELIFQANYSKNDQVSTKMTSSFYRELAYNIEHAIHHMALIKVAVNVSLTYIELPKDFGVASSTIRYRTTQY